MAQSSCVYGDILLYWWYTVCGISNKEVIFLQKYLEILKETPLFAGISEHALPETLACLGARTAQYQKGEYIWHEGDAATPVGVVLSGSVQIAHEDYWGDRVIMARAQRAELFGEAFAIAGIPAGAAAVASHDCEVLLFDCARLLKPHAQACALDPRLLRNMLQILADKNHVLTRKLFYVTRKTTREKLLADLSACAQAAGSASFSIPFDRQELADYLAVDRSAMSHELSRLRDEGVLRTDRRKFCLLQPQR